MGCWKVFLPHIPVGQVLEDLGYDVTLTPLDNGIMWEKLFSRARLMAWCQLRLPQTHAPQVEKSQG